MANAFFSTFPRRTHKTHPTLQNFNLADFFKNLNSNCQYSKLRSVLYYFEWLENNTENSDGKLRVSRQVSTKEPTLFDSYRYNKFNKITECDQIKNILESIV